MDVLRTDLVFRIKELVHGARIAQLLKKHVLETSDRNKVRAISSFWGRSECDVIHPILHHSLILTHGCNVNTSLRVPNFWYYSRRHGKTSERVDDPCQPHRKHFKTFEGIMVKFYKESRPFITFSGVYEFIRLPFWTKRAPSYFQGIMATGR